MIEAIRMVFALGPLIFGLAFLAPLLAQSLEALQLPAPLGLSPLVFGLIVGGTLGAVANLRGRWL